MTIVAPVTETSTCGDEYELTLPGREPVRAVITEVGAGLRELWVGGVALTPGYRTTTPRPFFSGVVLAPWPNRVRDGRWQLDGVPQQLDITEPEHGNALHGLLCFTAYRPTEISAAAVTLGARIHPQHGYPFSLRTRVRYALTDCGLSVTHTVGNLGSTPAPVAVGAHPFLGIGGVPTEDLVLTVAADRHIDVDARLNPIGTTAVAGTRWDLRRGRRVAELDLDDSWTGVRTVGGVSTHTLRAPDGRSVSLCAGTGFDYVHIFVTRHYPAPDGHVTAVAVEPMSAPADAFNSGSGLRWLGPGQYWSASWSIRYQSPVQ
ncbi:Aldose 1-epimerase [Mycobacterium sp. smrl_JER01]